jgi:hypothetical protein
MGWSRRVLALCGLALWRTARHTESLLSAEVRHGGGDGDGTMDTGACNEAEALALLLCDGAGKVRKRRRPWQESREAGGGGAIASKSPTGSRGARTTMALDGGSEQGTAQQQLGEVARAGGSVHREPSKQHPWDILAAGARATPSCGRRWLAGRRSSPRTSFTPTPIAACVLPTVSS